MQPPPRKVKSTVQLKNVQTEQVTKLQAKHQAEVDLLEDLRNFSKQRSVIEKDYAQALSKLAGQYLTKKDTPVSPVQTEDGKEYKTVSTVWRSLLEEMDRMAQKRLKAADVYMQQVSEPAKNAKNTKMSLLKKVIDNLQLLQKEVSQTVQEMAKTQKIYSDEEHLAHDARQKAAEAEEKLKRKSTGLFQSLASLQKNSAKFSTRKESCEVKSTSARNEYVLNMVAANAHQIRYYSTDLPALMKQLDGDSYERFQEFVTILGKTELDCVTAAHESLNKILTDAALVSRQYSLQCFLRDHLVFTNLVQYQFEPCDNDEIHTVTNVNGAEHQLNKEARKWATKVARENKVIKDTTKTLEQMGSGMPGDRTSRSSNTSGDTPGQDPEAKIEELRETIRKAETSKMKAEARLEVLKTAGIDVEEWLASANKDLLAPKPDGDSASLASSQMSFTTESSGEHSSSMVNGSSSYREDDEDFDTSFDTSANATMIQTAARRALEAGFPKPCIALYDFQATNTDELSIFADEQLEVIADGDGDGWVQAQKSDGVIGLVPENYLHYTEHVETSHDDQYTEDSSEVATPTTENTDIAIHHEVQGSYSSGDVEVQEVVTQQEYSTDDGMWAKALYDYEATNEEELTFFEGQIIRIIRKDENGVDDGWWEGELNGVVGVFPSLVVEELEPGRIPSQQNQHHVVPNVTAPVPPAVMITEPSPDIEVKPVLSNKPEIPRKPPGLVRYSNVPTQAESAQISKTVTASSIKLTHCSVSAGPVGPSSPNKLTDTFSGASLARISQSVGASTVQKRHVPYNSRDQNVSTSVNEQSSGNPTQSSFSGQVKKPVASKDVRPNYGGSLSSNPCIKPAGFKTTRRWGSASSPPTSPTSQTPRKSLPESLLTQLSESLANSAKNTASYQPVGPTSKANQPEEVTSNNNNDIRRYSANLAKRPASYQSVVSTSKTNQPEEGTLNNNNNLRRSFVNSARKPASSQSVVPTSKTNQPEGGTPSNNNYLKRSTHSYYANVPSEQDIARIAGNETENNMSPKSKQSFVASTPKSPTSKSCPTSPKSPTKSLHSSQKNLSLVGHVAEIITADYTDSGRPQITRSHYQSTDDVNRSRKFSRTTSVTSSKETSV